MFIPKNFDEEIILVFYKMIRLARKQFAGNQELHEPSVGQLQAMMAIDTGKNTTGEIADELQVAFPTATILLDKLVKAGLVDRVADLKDRRIMRLTLTEKGKNNLDTLLKAKMDRMKIILSKLSEEDKKDLHRVFSNLYTQLEKEAKRG